MPSTDLRIVEPRLGLVAWGRGLQWTGSGLVVATVLGLAWMVVVGLVAEERLLGGDAALDALSRGAGIGVIASGVAGGLLAGIGLVLAAIASPDALDRALEGERGAPAVQALRLVPPSSWRISWGLVLAVALVVLVPLGFLLAGEDDLPQPVRALAPAPAIVCVVVVVLCFRRVLRADAAWRSRVEPAQAEAARRRAAVDRDDAARRATMPAAVDFPLRAWHAVGAIDLAAGRLVAAVMLGFLAVAGIGALQRVLDAVGALVALPLVALAVVALGGLSMLVGFAVVTAWAELATDRWARRTSGVVADEDALGWAVGALRASALVALLLGCLGGLALAIAVGIVTAGPVGGIPVPAALDPLPPLVVAAVATVLGVVAVAVDAPLASAMRTRVRRATAPGDVRPASAADLRERRRRRVRGAAPDA